MSTIAPAARNHTKLSMKNIWGLC